VATQIEYPDACVQPASAIGEHPLRPHTVREPEPEEIWTVSLDQVVQLALANSQVMREIGGRIVQSPQTMSSVYDPSLQVTNPLTGEEAALSAFDAQLASGLFLSRDDRSFNNPLFAGAGFAAQAASLTTENGQFQTEVSKRAATGTYLALRNQTVRTSRNSSFELFPSYYETTFEAEFRQPLLRGAGIAFNRIAGPNTPVGSYNGIMVARVKTDIALADFERSVRSLVEDVQETYWLLYYAYRNLDARIAARDAALESWRNAKTKLDVGDGNILDESLTREQYFQFQTQVADALSGVGTDTSTSPARVGVYTLERQLRLLIGIDVNDGRLIRPADEPTKAEIVFDWDQAVDQAMFRRVELRRQQWSIKQREMELLAARNRLLMNLDLVGLYRRRGFGDALFGERNRENGSAFRDLYDGSLDGWQFGAQLSTPIGNRIGHAAVRNAELTLQRERALLREQERYVYAELSESFSELDRAYRQSRTNFNRVIAARQRLTSEVLLNQEGEGLLQFVLNAQSRLADAEAEYFRSLVDYNLAVAKVHFSQGTLLDYFGVTLTEGPWTEAAYQAGAKNSRRFKPRELSYCVTTPRPVGRGEYQQNVLPRGTDVIVDEQIVPQDLGPGDL
ncbi:MAG: TolC family protein, partial [Planctomycetales bacterium]|nr:TolC family protein [Planctomycetales bacterium]